MLGWSDGGITALCAAILHPKAIEKVAGIDMNITFDIYVNKKAPDKSHDIFARYRWWCGAVMLTLCRRILT